MLAAQGLNVNGALRGQGLNVSSARVKVSRARVKSEPGLILWCSGNGGIRARTNFVA